VIVRDDRACNRKGPISFLVGCADGHDVLPSVFSPSRRKSKKWTLAP